MIETSNIELFRGAKHIQKLDILEHRITDDPKGEKLMQLKQVIKRDFLLLHEDQSVEEAARIINRFKNPHIVVDGLIYNKHYYFLYSYGEFVKYIERGEKKAKLLKALSLKKRINTPIKDIYDEYDDMNIPNDKQKRYVVIDKLKEKVIGYYDGLSEEKRIEYIHPKYPLLIKDKSNEKSKFSKCYSDEKSFLGGMADYSTESPATMQGYVLCDEPIADKAIKETSSTSNESPATMQGDILCDEPRADKAIEETIPTSNELSRYLNSQFPDKVPLDESRTLQVWLSDKPAKGNDKGTEKLEATKGSRLDILVNADGFEVLGDSERSIFVTDPQNTEPISFKLKADALGKGRLTIYCYNGAQNLGSIVLYPEVIKAPLASDSFNKPITNEHLPALRKYNQDLFLRIMNRESGRKWKIDVYFHGENIISDAVLINKDPMEYFNDFLSAIEELHSNSENEQKTDNAKLDALGTGLLDLIIKKEEDREKLWDLREKITTIYVLTDVPWIPWELLKLYSRKENKNGPFLAEKYAITRWLVNNSEPNGLNPCLDLKLDNIALVMQKSSGLSRIEDERKFFEGLKNDKRNVEEIEPYVDEISKALSKGTYDGWFFSGHGEFNPANPDRSKFILGNDEFLPMYLSGLARRFGEAHPIVFMSACETGKLGSAWSGNGGWASAFTGNGAGAFIGTMWKVSDSNAAKFTKAFYTHLLKKEQIGVAAMKARNEIKSPDDPSWLAYAVFAAPEASLK